MKYFIWLGILVAVAIIVPAWSWRSQSSTKGGKKDEKEEFNIGLIAPHTNFGKREYLRAINSAILALQKMRGTKLGFLKDFSFSSTNVHFDMMSLTPSPTSMHMKTCFAWLYTNTIILFV